MGVLLPPTLSQSGVDALRWGLTELAMLKEGTSMSPKLSARRLYFLKEMVSRFKQFQW